MKTKRFKNVISVLCVAVLLAVALPIAINAQDGQKLQKQADVSVQQNDAVIENNLNSDKGGNVSSAQKENIKNYVQNNAIATAQKRKALAEESLKTKTSSQSAQNETVKKGAQKQSTVILQKNQSLTNVNLHINEIANIFGVCEVHEWEDEYTVDKAPTCEQMGMESRHCKHCNAVTHRSGINPIPHTYGEWTVLKEATCVDSGLEKRVCTMCGKAYETRETAPTGKHEWEDEYTVDKAPTCEQMGMESRHCKHCNAVTHRSGINPIPHTYGEWTVLKEATCVDSGLEKRVCTMCGKAYETRETAPTGKHEWEDEYTVDALPSPGRYGMKSRHCKHCNAVTHRTGILPEEYTNFEWDLDMAPIFDDTCN